jgi:hypothetical protein
VKLISTTNTKLVFQLGRHEKRLLRDTLNCYPRIPPAHQPLSKSGRVPDHDANQRLLNEALADQRAENKKQLQTWLADRGRFHETASGFQLSLSHSEAEWLLQVLNDIRVGSWVLLGSPEEKLPPVTAKAARDFWVMEMAGCFQMQLLEALEGET